jgi:hypothetical protein
MFENKPIDQPLLFSETIAEACAHNPELGVKLAALAVDLQKLRRETFNSQSDLLTYYESRDEGYKVGAEAWFSKSKKILEDEDAPAGILLLAMKNVLGPAALAWEPDTLWIELEDRTGLDVPRENRDKLLAAITLLEMPAFYWEVNTFQNTVMSFNHTRSSPDKIQEATAAELAWAVYEAEIVLHEHQQWEPEFDYEPRLYVAACLHRSGMLLAPKLLQFAQDELDNENKDGAKVTKEQVAKAWDKLSKSNLESQKFPETPLGVQLAKLAAVDVYVKDRIDNYAKYFSALRHS